MELLAPVLLLAVPIAYVIVLIRLSRLIGPSGVAISLLFVVIISITAAWALTRTAGSNIMTLFGFAVIPLEAAIGGFLGLTFARWKGSPDRSRVLTAWCALALAVLILRLNVTLGSMTTEANQASMAEEEVEFGETRRDVKEINDGLMTSPRQERRWVDSAIRARITDTLFVQIALHGYDVSPDLLDTLSASTNTGIALRAVLHRNARPGILADAYSRYQDSPLFVEALAGNANTPPAVLRAIYQRGDATYSRHFLAQNAGTPPEILHDIAKHGRNSNEMWALFRNPRLDCDLAIEASGHLREPHFLDPRDNILFFADSMTTRICRATGNL